MTIFRPAFALCPLLLAALALMGAPQRAPASCVLRAAVLGGCGGASASATYRAGATLGQPTPIGIGTSAGRILLAGFWGPYRIVTGTEEPVAPLRTMLRQNFPNPFNPTTTIEYSLALAGRVEIAIFDVEGRRVATLVDASRVAGSYAAVWDGTNGSGRRVASGIYFCRLATGSGTMIRKMILLR